MQNTSSVNTLAATATMTGTCATVEWIGNSVLKMGIPPQVVIEIGALVTTLAHFIVNCFNAYISVNDPRFAAALQSENIKTAPTTITQAGFASPTLLVVIAFCMILLTGCASQLQALTAANTSAVISIRADADLQAKITAEAFCTMSVDTLARNTQYVKGVQALCWAGSITSPSTAAEALVPPTGTNTAVIQAPVSAPVPEAIPVANVAPAVPVATPVKKVVKVVKPSPVAAPVTLPAPVAAPVAAPIPVPPVPTSLLSAPVIPN